MNLISTFFSSTAPGIEFFADVKETNHKISLWNSYNHIYIKDVLGNPRARYYMHKDPGVKFMRHGWWIVWGIIGIIYLIGCLPK